MGVMPAFPAAPVIGFAHPSYDFAPVMAAQAPAFECRHFRSREALAAGVNGVDVLAQGSVLWDGALLARAGKLRLIQSLSVGVEHFDLAGLRARGIRLANAQGCVDGAVAEHAMGLMLTLTRQLHLARDAQKARHFGGRIGDPARRPGELAGRTLLVVGLGAIGARLAVLAKAFGMRVTGLRRDPALGPEGADAVIGPAGLAQALTQADIVALACPLTPETGSLIDAAALASMKPSALLINVARGKVVDEPALIAALQAGRIAGAGLDCFWAEPLPPDSPLWAMENVVLTPHSAGETGHYEERLAAILLENVARLRRGEARLVNEVGD